jgi:hypothetical protein
MDDIHRGSQIQFRDKGKKPNYKHGHDGICTILSAPCDKEFADCVNCERLQEYNERVKQKLQRHSHKHSKKSGSGSSIGLFIVIGIVLIILAYLVYHGYL